MQAKAGCHGWPAAFASCATVAYAARVACRFVFPRSPNNHRHSRRVLQAKAGSQDWCAAFSWLQQSSISSINSSSRRGLQLPPQACCRGCIVVSSSCVLAIRGWRRGLQVLPQAGRHGCRVFTAPRFTCASKMSHALLFCTS